MELSKDEMYMIDGGAVSWKILAGIGAGIVLVMGMISGYTNPEKCNNR